MKLPYIKEMNGHIPQKLNVFLKKLDFKVTFILINETFNLKRIYAFKERQNKLHPAVWFIVSHAAAKARILVRLPGI